LCFDGVLDIEPENSDALFQKALSLVILGKHQEAIPLFDKALFNDPANVEILYNKGLALHVICQYENAITCYDQILTVDRNNTKTLYSKSKTILMQGKILDSLNILRKIVDQEPIYKEIIKKDKDFDRLKDNQLFKVILKARTEFDKLNEKQIFNKVKQ